MIRAQASELGQLCQRDVFRKVLLDIGGHCALLPAGKAAARRHFGPLRSGAEAYQLVRQNDAEGLEIALIVRAAALDKVDKLMRRIPQRGVLEEQAGSQSHKLGASVR